MWGWTGVTELGGTGVSCVCCAVWSRFGGTPWGRGRSLRGGSRPGGVELHIIPHDHPLPQRYFQLSARLRLVWDPWRGATTTTTTTSRMLQCNRGFGFGIGINLKPVGRKYSTLPGRLDTVASGQLISRYDITITGPRLRPRRRESQATVPPYRVPAHRYEWKPHPCITEAGAGGGAWKLRSASCNQAKCCTGRSRARVAVGVLGLF
jgi:hypothetical protein